MSETVEPKSTCRILIVDDHPLYREGLRQLIEREPGLSICGEAAGANEVLQMVAETRPNLVIVDISLGATNGIDLVKTLKSIHPELPVLVVSMHDESLYAERAIRAGAKGYVMKHEPPKTLKTAIYRVLEGQMYLSQNMATSLVEILMRGDDEPEETSLVNTLSDRELEVFRLMGEVKSAKQIAQELNLAITTVSSFRSRIREKLHLNTSMELMQEAVRWVQDEKNKAQLP